MYKYIINPFNKKRVSIGSKVGKNIIKKYLNFIIGGGDLKSVQKEIVLPLLITNEPENIDFSQLGYEIPKFIISTHRSKDYIPLKVYKNISEYAPNYKHIIFDDKDIIIFLKKYYRPEVLEAFNSLKGPHKADLFRYCYLYKFGGIYLDIKTELIKNIDSIFNKKDINLYTVISSTRSRIHQGIIAAIPKNPIFIYLINDILNINKPVKSYHHFTRYFSNKLKEIYGLKQLENGEMISSNKNIRTYLFEEKCTKDQNDCKDGLDRYNRCCHVYDNGSKIIKTRYSDYPWRKYGIGSLKSQKKKIDLK